MSRAGIYFPAVLPSNSSMFSCFSHFILQRMNPDKVSLASSRCTLINRPDAATYRRGDIPHIRTVFTLLQQLRSRVLLSTYSGPLVRRSATPQYVAKNALHALRTIADRSKIISLAASVVTKSHICCPDSWSSFLPTLSF